MESAPNPQPLTLHHPGNQSQLVPMPYMAEFQDPDEEELDLGQLFAVIRRRAFVILGVATLVTGGVAVWTANQTPEYEGKFQILVEPVTSQDDNFSRISALAGGLGGQFLQGQGSGLDYDSQLAVLQSPKLMDPIVQQLQARYPELDYNALIGGNESPLSLDRFNKNTKILEVRYRDAEPEKIQFVLETLQNAYLRYSLEDRKSNISQGIQFIEDQLPQLRQRVDTLQEQLQKFRQQYNIIEPQLQGEQLAQQLTKLDDQLLEAQAQLVQEQQLYETLRRQIGLEPGTAIAASVLSEAPTYQARLNRLKELENQIAAESTRFTPNSPQVQVLLEERRTIELLLGQEASEVLGSQLPGGVVGNPQAPFQNTIRTGLIQEMVKAASQIQVLQVRNQVLGEAAKMLSEYREQFPVILRQYTDLQRELQIANTTLTELLARREGLRVDAAEREIPWEVISSATIPRNENGELVPVSPSLPRNLVLGAMLGLMLGFGAALLAERLDNVFHSPEDLKDATRLPILGLIPASDRSVVLPSADARGGAAVQDFRDFGFLEAFRALNANIRFLTPGKPLRSVAIASAIPAEGKSTVAVNLAEAAASMGQRVLLVDADLRWPQVHKRLGLPNRQGLTHLIATEMDMNEAIQRSPVEPNLFILTAGATPPDPIRLLSSEKMHNLMQQWHSLFDLVIYDTPPLLGVVDGRVLAAYTDGIGLVVSIGQTEKPAIQQAIAELQTGNTKVLGIIANGVQGQNSAWDYSRHYNNGGDRELEAEEEEEAISL
ncbi:polysaccharide biosynthesis tyrosine autokinase [Oscillatoria sp. HE19RPO]|uniref:GumC family protein n=1 Tax=Oscillatoria sp. HE19RPO TaxID=2954806 RepID=UPI0020C1F5F9|nr:polysaccharide biosynthesis tyrosine autokinase [Oscillatoria sp. HE19RPO]